MRVILSCVLCVTFSFIFPWQNSLAENPEWKANTQFLPQYCKDRAKGSQSPSFKRWRKTFGKAGVHMHHYCDGLYAEKQAKVTADKNKRSHWLRLAAYQMQYVSGSCQPGCVLYPELHSIWGWALWQQGQVGEAIKHYQLAIQSKPTYTRAYADLADMYVKINESDEARKVLEAGLKVNPKSRKLKRRLLKLQPAA